MPAIDLRTAVQNIRNHINEFKDILGKNIDSWTIEETELSEDEKFWLITVSFKREIDPRERKSTPVSTGILSNEILKSVNPPTIEKDYKVFKVDAVSGDVVSMKIYHL